MTKTTVKTVDVGFGSGSSRFCSLGLHPKHLATEKTSIISANLGPGCYDIKAGNQNSSNQGENGGWKKQVELERWSKTPYFACKDAVNAEKELAKKLGPGCYFKDANFLSSTKKDVSRKGMLDSKVPRFKDDLNKFVVPGAGYYGTPNDEKAKKDFGLIGLLSSGGQREQQRTTQVTVGPGTYHIEGSIENLLKKKVGNKGPYECFTLDRNKPVPTGHRSVLMSHSLGPGQYDIQYVDSKSTAGKFRKLGQNCGRSQSFLSLSCDLQTPGPGHYDPKHSLTTFSTNHPPFLTSTSRNSKITSRFEQGSYSSVGPGRYNHQELIGKSGSGHQSCFRSKSTLADSSGYDILQERLKVKSSGPWQTK